MGELSYEKPKVELIGQSGNAFMILGRVKGAMKRAGASQEELDSYISKATVGDYDNLLQTTMEYVDIQ